MTTNGEIRRKLEAAKAGDNSENQIISKQMQAQQQFVGKKTKVTDKPPGFAICAEEPQNLKRSRHSLEKGSGSTVKKGRVSREDSHNGSNQNSLHSQISGGSRKSERKSTANDEFEIQKSLTNAIKKSPLSDQKSLQQSKQEAYSKTLKQSTLKMLPLSEENEPSPVHNTEDLAEANA